MAEILLMRARMRIVLCGALLSTLIATTASAAETPAPAAKVDKQGTIPVLGAQIGFVDASRRLGPSFDIAAHIGIRKALGNFGVTVGLRPHYERFGLGHSDDKTCSGVSGGQCANGSVLYISQTFGNAFSVEIPVTAELRTGWKTIVPFIGAAPWFTYLRATESSRPLLPSGDRTETSTSSTFLGVGAFLGASVPVGDNGQFVARFGYRFMGYKDDVAGGRASPNGEFFGIGYMHDL